MEKTKQDHKQKKAELEQQHKLEMRQIEHRNLLETTALFTKANQGKAGLKESKSGLGRIRFRKIRVRQDQI